MPRNSTATATKPKKAKARLAEGGSPTWEMAYFFPAQGTWSEEEYFDLDGLFGNRLVELSDGYLEVLPMPTESHQLIVLFLVEVLRAFAKTHAPGTVLCAPMKVKLWTAKYREPDVLYMQERHAQRRHEKYWEGADLVMEVLSSDPHDRKRDLEEKPREYARARIPEYWIIDPDEGRIRILTLKGKAYRVHGDFGCGARAAGVLLPGFVVSVDSVLSPPGSRR